VLDVLNGTVKTSFSGTDSSGVSFSGIARVSKQMKAGTTVGLFLALSNEPSASESGVVSFRLVLLPSIPPCVDSAYKVPKVC
jgi:hypothetical protein